jgi:hypothetical protein
MTFNWGGLAAAFQGAQQQQRIDDEEARRKKADARADSDAAFQDEQRTRQRTDWQEADRIRDADKADRAAVNAQFDAKKAAAPTGPTDADVADAQQQVDADKQQATIDSALAAPADTLPSAVDAAQAAPSSVVKTQATPSWAKAAPAAADTSNSPKLDPAVAAKIQQTQAAGMPAPQDFNDSLDRQLEFLRRKNVRGDLKPEEYAASVNVLNKMQNEGVNDALALMSQGRYDDAMKRYNSVGAMRGASIINAEEGTTKINGENVPTHYITVRNPDGTRTTMDVAKAQYQLLDMNTQLQHADRARTTQMQESHFNQSYELQKKEMEQHARDAAAQRALEMRRISIAEAASPTGQIAAKEKILGRPLTTDEKSQLLGIDSMPPQTRAQLTSLLKEVEGISSAMNKAQSENMWDPNSVGAKQIIARHGILNQQITDLLSKTPKASAGGAARASADPAGILGPAAPASGKPAPGATKPAQVVPNSTGQGPAATPAAPTSSQAPRAALAPVGGIAGKPLASSAAASDQPSYAVQKIAKAIGLSSNNSLNNIVIEQASRVKDAADSLRIRRDMYIDASKRGDQVAAAQALNNFNAASAAYNQTLDRLGNNADAVRAAVDDLNTL